MRAALLGVLAALGAVPALAQSPPPPAKDFVNAAMASDSYEILAGQTAVNEARDPRVRAFAEQMIRDHTQSSQSLRQAAQQAGVQPPPPLSLDEGGSRMLNSLQSLRGQDFDRAYAKQQVLAHAQAITVVGLYAQGGQAGPVRQAAQTAIPMIRKHDQRAHQLKAALGGS